MIPGNDATLRSMLHYRNALHIDPNHADSLWNYGEHLRLEGHIERAISCFEKLLAMNQVSTVARTSSPSRPAPDFHQGKAALAAAV
jgi:Tfp pilus assembly protein PilF